MKHMTGRGLAVRTATIAAIAVGVVSGPGLPLAAAGEPFDLVVKDQDRPTIDLIRPKRSLRFSAGNLHQAPFATTAGGPLEIWAHRPQPGGPLTLDQIGRSTGEPVATPLAGLRARLDRGLIDFLRYRIRDTKGKTVAAETVPICPNGQSPFGEPEGAEASREPRRRGLGPQPMMPWWGQAPCGEEQADSLVWLFGPGHPLYHYGSEGIPLPDGRYVYEAVLNPSGDLPEAILANNRFRQSFSLRTDREAWRELMFRPEPGGPPPAATAAARGSGRSSAPRAPEAGEIDGEPGALPDPAALPASRFAFVRQGRRQRISFSSIVKNAGEAPIELFGQRSGTAGKTMPGWQYTKDSAGQVVKRETNGFVWDNRDTHFHWHYNKLAVYELLGLDGTVLRRSDKVGFCFMPTTLLRFLPAPGPVGQGAPTWFGDVSQTDCGQRDSRRVAMSLPAGWGDEYYQGIAGQSLDVTALPAGNYRLRITVNPEGDLAESDPGNNVSERLISIGGSGANRSLTVPRQGIVSPEFHPLKRASDLPGGYYAAASGVGPLGGPAATAPVMFCGLRGR